MERRWVPSCTAARSWLCLGSCLASRDLQTFLLQAGLKPLLLCILSYLQLSEPLQWYTLPLVNQCPYML